MGSAKVVMKEIDLSARVPSFPGVTGAMVIPARKGPVNTRQLITSDTDLLRKMTANETIEVGMDGAYFSALAYLEKSDKLYVVRAAKNALFGGFVVKSNGSTYLNYALGTGIADAQAYDFDAQPDLPGQAEVTRVVCVADVAGSLNNKYFTLNAVAGGYYVWLNVGSSGTDPAVAGRTGIEVAVAADATDATVAAAVRAAVAAISAQFTATVLTNAVTITNVVAGSVADALDTGTTGFTITTPTQGVTAISTDDDAMIVYGANQGVWANDIGIKVRNYATSPDLVKEPDAFYVYVYKRGNENTPVETFLCSRIKGKKDGYGKNIYVEDVLLASNYIRAFSNPAIAEATQPKEQLTIQYLAGGSDGTAVTDAEMILALDALRSTDDVVFTLIMDGGWATPAYHAALRTLCETRQDCVAIMSTPISDEADADYMNSIVDYRKVEQNLNTSYGALFTPHCKVYDKYNDRYVYVAPDGYVGAAISFSAANFEVWFPPAGFKRGMVNVLDLRRRFNEAERDQLYDVGINPLRFAPGRGILIWGQKTLLTRPSSLDRLHVRLLLISISPAIKVALENFMFELNDDATRSQVRALISSSLSNVQARRGLTAYKVVCDETNNTPEDIDSSRMIVWTFLTPPGSTEEIPTSIVITRTGVDFNLIAQSL